MRTRLDCPAVMATASKVPEAPGESDPAQPDGPAAWRFHRIVSASGTPNWSWTVFAAGDPHAAESHTTWPFLVTTTRTAPAPYAITQRLLAVETAYTSNWGQAPWP